MLALERRVEKSLRETKLPYYESVFIARQDVTVAQVDSLSEDFCKIIEDHGGTVAKVERWGLRSLAYRIKKNRKGHYILIGVDAPSEAIHEMERQMRLNEDVLRYMTIRVDALDKTPSPLAQAATERHVNVAQTEEESSDEIGDANVEGDQTVEAVEPGDDAAEDVEGDDK